MNKKSGIPDSLKEGMKLPLLQSGLTMAGAITQLSVGALPKITPIPELSERFCRRVNFITSISDEDKKILENFRIGILLANHPNRLMADFPAWLRYLNYAKENQVRIGTGLSVTPMYRRLLPNTQTFLAQLKEHRRTDLSEVQRGIEESINFVNYQQGILILPYFEGLGATHRRILEGVGENTNILQIESSFPQKIGYKKMYSRILSRRNTKLEVEVEVSKKIKGQLGNQ